MFLAISFGAIAITIFVFSCLLLAGTLYFFGDSFTSLKEIKKQIENEKRLVSMPAPQEEPKKSASLNALLPKKTLRLKVLENKGNKAHEEPASLADIKQSIMHQQEQLNALLKKAENWNGSTAHGSASDKEERLYEKIERLELLLEEKEEALQHSSQHTEVSDQMSVRLEQAEKEFEILQQRIAGLEKQAAAANELAMQLEDIKEEYKTLKKELARKTEKLHEFSTENGRLHKQLCDTEDKLQAANTHRHQLSKRVALLEGLNNDFQEVSETNNKLKNELRRIGELESMLNMMIEERNHLLNRG
jgi:chromosome segregation ATPase